MQQPTAGILTVSNSVTGCLSGGYAIGVTVVALPTTPAIGGGGKTAMCRATNGQFYSVPLNAGNTYTWSIAPATPIALGGNATDNFIVLNFPNPGVYTLSVREFTPAPLGCAGPLQTLAITVYDNPVADAGLPRTICEGNPTTLGGAPTASGGSGTFTYLWTPSFGLDDATLPNPVATTNATRTYTLNVNDVISGCATVIKSVVVTVNPLPTVYNVTGPDYYCFGTPGITLTLSGSQAGVDYQLYKNAVISGAVKPGTGGGLNWPGLTTGTYTVKAANTVTLCANDMNGSITVAENPDVIINSITPVEPSCFSSSDGVISISASGGTGALLYSVNNGATYQSSGTFGSLPQGTYNIIVKDTRGCTKTGIQVLTQPPALSITSITVTNSITCFGGTNGSARVVVGGGTPIYTYQWYNDSGLTSPIAGQVTDEVTGRAAGTYYVKITDFNGCWISANITLTQPAALTAVVTPTNVTCNGVPDGIINVTAPTGGSGAYEYSKDGGIGWQATGLFNALAPGTYDVRIRDLANPTCVITLNSSLTITQPNVLSAVVTSTNVTCNLAADGTITVSSPTGGYGTYDYSIGGLWQATGTFTGLAPVNYVVSIRDRAHPACVIVLDPSRSITEPAALSATLNSTNITCFSANNGTITITAPLGGSGTYQYTINGGTTWQSSGSFTNLAPAIAYDVRMRDAANIGCANTLNGSLTLTEPNVLSATVTNTNVTCSGAGDGTITITNPLGGYGTYDYTVDGGATWQASGNFTSLIPGFYNVQIRDRANQACVIILNGSLQLTQPAVLSANVARTNVTCNGVNDGTITITSPSGGYGTYEYSIGGPWQASGSFTNLIPDTYVVQIRDQAHPACVIVLNSNLVITEPVILSATVTPTNVTCNVANDGIITITGATGGSGTYQYSINGTTWQVSPTFTNLTPILYNVSMRDAANIGCVLPLGSYTITEPNVLAATLNRTNVTCFGSSDGTITISGATGGYGNYEYSINGGGQWQASGSFTALIPGYYNVMMRDRDHISCVKVLNNSYQITQPAVLNAVVTPTNVTCNSVSDGIISITGATGGSGSYDYSIDGGLTWQLAGTGLFTGLAPVTYDVRIRDAINTACVIILNPSLIITQPDVLNGTVTSTNVTCNLAADGTITVSSPMGGYGTYDYSIGGLWQATGTFTGLAPVNYVVSIRDRAHPACVIVLDPSRSITEPAALSATLNSTNITCFSANNGTITITAPLGGSGTYQYTINGGTTWQSSGSFTNLAPAIAYDVRMRDAANTGCTLTLDGTLTLTQPNILSATVTNTNVTCSGAGDGTITITNPLGGYGTYDYTVNGGTAWQPGGNFTALIPGFYNVQIRDRANPACVIIVQGSLQITQPAALSANVAKTNVTCNGVNDGTITISSPSGGYGTYEYSIGGPWQISGNFINLAPNTYTVSMRDQLHPTCVIVPGPNPVITQPAVLAATVTTTNVTCNAAGDGIIAITGATGGYGTYQYSINGTTWQGSGTFINVAPGTYNVSMRDAANNGCILPLGSYIITQPNVLAATLNRTNVTCFGAADGTISITGATGGYGNYEYTINGGGSWQASGIFAALGPGFYNVIIRDRDHISCVIVLSNSYQVTQPAALTATVTKTDVSCFGDNNGTITISSPTGGSGTYQYSVDGGGSWVGSGSFSNLVPATYDVRIRDAANTACAVTLYPNMVITEPILLGSNFNRQYTSRLQWRSGWYRNFLWFRWNNAI